MRDFREHAGIRAGNGLCTDFNESELVWIGWGEQTNASGDNQLAENRARRCRGKKICSGSIADPTSCLSIVADRRVIERQIHEAGKMHRTGGIGLCPEYF